jgi:hypothetical protein
MATFLTLDNVTDLEDPITPGEYLHLAGFVRLTNVLTE